MTGRLSVVATPIGNVEDVTLRALRVLTHADGIVAEDARRTRRLLSALNISASVSSFPAFAEVKRTPQLLARLQAGEKLAFCTDCGTPAVSDPGRRLIDAAIDAGIEVEVIPGPSALTAAISVSGLDAAHVAFLGFAPRTRSRLSRSVAGAFKLDLAVAFFESPQRLQKTLAALAEISQDRRAVVARELTKVHETVHRGTCASLADLFAKTPPRGECTVLIEAR
jgi:16S rRNA (cytidine1402-2'-O)-methyltransferase